MKPFIKKLWMATAMLCLSFTANAYDFIVDGIAYTITSFSGLTCAVSPSDAPYEGEITVPAHVTFNGKNLTVTSISDGAFKNSLVASIHIPETVIRIEANAFAGCESLNSISLRDGLLSIGNDAFNGCINLSDFEFPNKLISIGSACFTNCKSLTQIVLPTSIKVIGASSFMNCENIKKVTLSNLSIIEANTFKGCLNLHDVEWGNQLQIIKDYAFADCGFIKFVIPNTVTTIGTQILSGNKNLQSFTIGTGISKITSDPIAECPNVSEFVIADGTNPLTLDFSTSSYSLITRYSLGGIYYYYYSRPGAYNISTFDTVYVGRPLINPYSEEEFYNPAYNYNYTLPPFYGNQAIKKITLGANVKSIDGVSFLGRYHGWLEGCTNLETLDIRSLESISDSFIKDATSIKSIKLPNSVNSIGNDAFQNCTSLESIMFGSKLSEIGSNALENCNALKSIYCKSMFPPSYSTGFNKDIYLYCNLYIPINAEQYYKSKSPWNNFWNIQESQDCVSEFEKDGLVYSVSGNSVVVIGNAIEEDCNLVIPSHVEYNTKVYNVVGIDEKAFEGATYLHSIVIPGCIAYISNDAFSGCNGLSTVIFDASSQAITLGYNSKLNLRNYITPYPNATTVDEKRTGFRNGYYNGLFYGLPIERLIINRNIETMNYYERTIGSSTSSYPTVYNDIVYIPPFFGLTNLKYVEIGDNVSAICTNQIEAVVDAVPTTMEYTNFGDCDKIEVVVSNNPNAPIGGGFSETAYKDAYLFLPNGGENSYHSDNYWKKFTKVSEASFTPIKSISFESESELMDINDNKVLLPIINPAEASIKTLKWISSNPSLVQISDNGTLTSSSWREGEATITATTCDGSNISASVKVVVQKGAGVSDVINDDKICVSVENGKLIVRGKVGNDKVFVYNAQGQLIISTEANEIDLTEKGIYIIRIGSFSKKIII